MRIAFNYLFHERWKTDNNKKSKKRKKYFNNKGLVL